MSLEEFEKLTEEDQGNVRDECLDMAWDWVCDHHSCEDEETLNEIAEEIWSDFLHEVE